MDGKTDSKLIIGGARSEIGGWISSALSEKSSSVITTSRIKLSGNVSLICDPTSYEDYINLFTLLLEQGVKLNSIYYCPGAYHMNSISCVAHTDWVNDININFIGAYLAYRAFVQVHKLENINNVKFVFLGSTSSVSQRANLSSYWISKKALEDLASVINNESQGRIRSVCLRIGTCQTSFSNSSDNANMIDNSDISDCIDYLESCRFSSLPEYITLRPIPLR